VRDQCDLALTHAGGVEFENPHTEDLGLVVSGDDDLRLADLKLDDLPVLLRQIIVEHDRNAVLLIDDHDPRTFGLRIDKIGQQTLD
jgi:hypothetical protein